MVLLDAITSWVRGYTFQALQFSRLLKIFKTLSSCFAKGMLKAFQ